MANPSRKHPLNALGSWFVDDTCIDCDAARQCAPEIFGVHEGMSYVRRQPATEDEVMQATRAMLVCPTGSIGVTGMRVDPAGLFPFEITDGVYLCGYNARKSFGASSYFVTRRAGNILVDSPRFNGALVRAFEERGGIQDVLLTHRDHVADAARYAGHFGARVWIHEADRQAAPFATDLLRGFERQRIRDELMVIPVPGHTRGSVLFLLDERFLFSGDSLYWSRTLDRLYAFSGVCWYSWKEHRRSLERLRDVSFEWVLPGHGDRHHASPEDMRASLERLVEDMARVDVPAARSRGEVVW